jgi:hypothetical protein
MAFSILRLHDGSVRSKFLFFEGAIMGMRVGQDLGGERALMARVLEHYRLVGPLIEASFAQTPIVFVNYPGGVDKGATFHVTTVPLTSEKLLWLIHREYAVEFYTWAPTLLDVERLRYARILLEAPAGGWSSSA